MSEIKKKKKTVGLIISESKIKEVSPTHQISYSWGDKFELNQWMIMKDKEISGMRAFGNSNLSKYPLIWLISPIEGEFDSYGNIFPNTQFIVAMDTKAQWLNSTREKETMPILTKISNCFLNSLDESRYSSIIKKEGIRKVNFKKVYNYQEVNAEKYKSSENSNQTFENWDVIVLKFDLKINNNCLKNIQLCQ